VNAWIAAAIALLPALCVPLFVAARGRIPDRLVAAQLTAVIGAALLVVLSFGFDQPSFIDLALTLVLLSLPGTLVFALFLERWL
jgi:multicomponent Na+:H+ antiporter subunit F